jgi:hypothetical protein
MCRNKSTVMITRNCYDLFMKVEACILNSYQYICVIILFDVYAMVEIKFGTMEDAKCRLNFLSTMRTLLLSFGVNCELYPRI